MLHSNEAGALRLFNLKGTIKQVFIRMGIMLFITFLLAMMALFNCKTSSDFFFLQNVYFKKYDYNSNGYKRHHILDICISITSSKF